MNASRVLENISESKNVSQLAQSLGLSKHSIYSFVRNNKIGYTKRGKRLFFTKKNIEDFIVSTTKEVLVSPENMEVEHA